MIWASKDFSVWYFCEGRDYDSDVEQFAYIRLQIKAIKEGYLK